MLADGGASPGPPAWLAVVVVLAITAPIAIAIAWVGLIRRPRYLLYYCPRKLRQLSDGSCEVNFYLSGRGRRDITREAFDNNQPIEFDIGALIRKLTVESWPAAQPVVEHHAEGTRLLVGPGLIGRRQDLRFTVITGRGPRPIPRQSLSIDPPSIDPEVRLTTWPPRLRWITVSGCVVMAYLIVATIVLAALGVIGFVGVVAFVIGFVPFGIWILSRGHFPAPPE